MKKKILKALLAAGTLAIAWNCSDDPASPKAPEYAVTSSPAWLFQGDTDYILYPNGKATNAQGDVIGTFLLFENSTVGVLKDTVNNVVLQGIDLMMLTQLDSNTQVYAITGEAKLYKGKDVEYIIYPLDPTINLGYVTDVNGNHVAFFNYATNEVITVDGSLTVLATIKDINALPTLMPGDKFTKAPEPPSSSSVAPSSSSTVPPS